MNHTAAISLCSHNVMPWTKGTKLHKSIKAAKKMIKEFLYSFGNILVYMMLIVLVLCFYGIMKLSKVCRTLEINYI